MKTISTFCLILLISSVFGDDEISVSDNNEKNDVQTNSENLKEVIDREFRSSDYLELKIKPNSNVMIAPYAFNNSQATGIWIDVMEPSEMKQDPAYSLSLVQDSFAGMSELKELIFHNLNFDSSNEKPFASLGSLLRLSIGNSNMTEVPTRILASVPQIEALGMPRNRISAIQLDSFGSLKTLEILDLRENGISYIESGAFDGLSGLTELWLAGNPLGKIKTGLFNNLKSLKMLDLKDCNITEIASGAFGELRDDQVDLRGNNIKTEKNDSAME